MRERLEALSHLEEASVQRRRLAAACRVVLDADAYGSGLAAACTAPRTIAVYALHRARIAACCRSVLACSLPSLPHSVALLSLLRTI